MTVLTIANKPQSYQENAVIRSKEKSCINERIHKLYEDINNPNSFIEWAQNGKAIKIKDLQAFGKVYTKGKDPKKIRGTVYKFFNNYGFEKVLHNDHTFTNPNFKKDHPHLLPLIRNTVFRGRKRDGEQLITRRKFIKTLYETLSKPNDYMQWNLDGRSFKIINFDKFMSEYPGQAKKELKFDSFLKQIYNYKFRRRGMEFFNAQFIRGNDKEIQKIKRSLVSRIERNRRATIDSTSEDDSLDTPIFGRSSRVLIPCVPQGYFEAFQQLPTSQDELIDFSSLSAL